MNELTVDEKRELIGALCKKHLITAYEIGENTTISSVAAHNILTGVTINPREKSLNIILTYIESKIVGSAIPGEKNYIEAQSKNEAAEKSPAYKNSNEEILTAIKRLEILLTNDINTVSEAVGRTFLNTLEIKEDTSELKEGSTIIRSSIDNLKTLLKSN